MRARSQEPGALASLGTAVAAALLATLVCLGLLTLGAGRGGITHLVLVLLLHPLLWLFSTLALLGARDPAARRSRWLLLTGLAAAGAVLARFFPIV
ncbi:MAG: hypothetical protein AAGH15_05340 [Myxococcota bacterium]